MDWRRLKIEVLSRHNCRCQLLNVKEEAMLKRTGWDERVDGEMTGDDDRHGGDQIARSPQDQSMILGEFRSLVDSMNTFYHGITKARMLDLPQCQREAPAQTRPVHRQEEHGS